jgi:hypothetical protein
MEVVYRIRYSDTMGQRQHEVLVEANNTTEAMVKFCHARGPDPRENLPGAHLSISPELADGQPVGSESRQP